MTDHEPEATPVQIGDLVPTWILDDDGNLVGVTMARVTCISEGGEVELEDPEGAGNETSLDFHLLP
jgi:hypothetical protein